ncbi:MAG: neutral/alkaline non-lysosomal ceramidase N-terminal domain-containing protein, partial [Chloroflexota bacterium]
MPETAKLYAGVARRIISPPRGLYLVGYGNRLQVNTGVHDDLTATALVLRSDDECVAIVACDVLAISAETLTRIQSAVHSHVLVCCSHTHAAPMTHAPAAAPRWYRRYVDFLVAQIVDVIQLAEKNARPARLSCAVDAVDVAVNRRQRNPNGLVVIGQNPDGPVDRSLAVVQVADQQGAVMATLVNMACHPTVLRPDNRMASADWPGVMRAVVEAQTKVPCLFVQGACGDLGPRVQRHSQMQWAECTRLGQEVGEAVLALVHSTQP